MKNLMIVMGALALSGCVMGSDSATRAGAVDAGQEPTWHLISMNGTPYTGPATLRFIDGGRVAAYGTCNLVSGDQTSVLPEFNVGPMYGTKRACLRGAELEDQYFKTLKRVDTAQISGDRMTLTSKAGGAQLVFSSAAK